MTEIDVLQQLEQAQQAGLTALAQIDTEDALLAWRNQYLGKNTAITQAFQSLGKIPAELRPQVGQSG